jgi:hypothetical protein
MTDPGKQESDELELDAETVEDLDEAEESADLVRGGCTAMTHIPGQGA